MLQDDRKYWPHMAAIVALSLLAGACDEPPHKDARIEGASPEIQAAFRQGFEEEFARGFNAGLKAATESGCTVKQMFGR